MSDTKHPHFTHQAQLGNLYDRIEQLAKDKAELVAMLEWVKEYAQEARLKWDKGEDTRVGKMLIALECLPGYRADVDAFHALLKRMSNDETREPVNPPTQKL